MSKIESQIEEQQRLVSSIRDLQATEKALRAEILEELFGDSNVGSVKTQVSNLIVTGEYGLTYKLSQDQVEEAIETGVLDDEVLGAIRVKYELDKKAYDKLSDEAAEVLNEMLTITPALPSMKVKTVEE